MTRFAQAIVLLLVVASLVACAGPSRPQVRLATAEPSAGQTPEQRPEIPAASTASPLRIAVASVVSPKETYRGYQDLIAYVGRRLGRPAEIVQRATYAEVNALVRTGKVDLAFVCTLAYVEGRREFGMELLASPVVRGRPEYYSNVIVPADSGAQSLADLRGRVFAFSDPMSNTGWLAPTYALARLGETPETFFRRAIYTYSHDNSIRAVADHLVDGAAVDSLVYESSIDRWPELRRRLRVVDQYGPYATPPVVVGPGLAGARRARLRTTLLEMSDDPEGRRILDDLEIDRFTLLEDRAYDSIREMRDAVQPREQGQP